MHIGIRDPLGGHFEAFCLPFGSERRVQPRGPASSRSETQTLSRGEPLVGLVRLGTSSWSEKGWLGSFYPPGELF